MMRSRAHDPAATSPGSNAGDRHFLSGLSSDDRVEVPGPGDAPEFVLCSVHELEAGASDQLGDGARNEDFPEVRKG